jgi:hypothetical protein
MDETSQKGKDRVLSRAHALLSKDGEVHLVLEEDSFVGEATEELFYDEEEVNRVLKKEASKPLLLLREE